MAPALLAQDSRWSERFDRPGLLRRVFSLGSFDGDLLAGGGLFTGEGRELLNPARFDGAEWRQMGEGLLGLVHDYAVFQDELYACGDFRTDGSFQQVQGIARWDGSAWLPVGGGIGDSPHVASLAVFRGELYAGGAFSLDGGQTFDTLVRFDGTSWVPVGTRLTPQHPSILPRISKLLASDANHLYVAGEFSGAGSVSSYNVILWDGAAWQPLGTGLPGTVGSRVHDIESYGGRIYAGFNYDTSPNNGATLQRIAAWDGRQWQPVGGGIPSSVPGTSVDALAVFGGELYASGSFTRISGMRTDHVARWDGTSWSTFGGVRGGVPQTAALAMAAWDGQLAIGGEFGYGGRAFGVGQAVVSNSVIAFDGRAFGPVGTGFGLDDDVLDATLWNGGIVAVGRFFHAGNARTSSVAFFDGDGWQSLGDFDRNVHGVVVHNGNLVVTGDFTSIDGQPIRSIARYDGTAWHGYGGGAGGADVAVFQSELYAAGLSGLHRWDGSAWRMAGAQLFGGVRELQVYSGALYANGSLGSPGNGNIARWDGTTMSGVGGGVDGRIDSMTVHNGELIVGGTFTNAGGAPARHIARWDGNAWRQLGPGLGASVTALAPLRGELYASGQFNSGTGDPVEYIGRFDGSQWQPLGSGLLGLAQVLLPEERLGRLWVGGAFREAGGLRAAGLTHWDARPIWADLGGGLAGARGVPELVGFGNVRNGGFVSFEVAGMQPNAAAAHVLGTVRADLPVLGGVLAPRPDVTLGFVCGPDGREGTSIALRSGVTPGIPLFVQSVGADAGAPVGLAFTNAIRTTSQ